MDKSSRIDIPLEEQRDAWNRWNSTVREKHISRFSERQAAMVIEAIEGLKRQDLRIIEIGCGPGWLCERLQPFGKVTGTDLSDEVLARAQQRWPAIEFIAGDFMSLPLPEGKFDVAVTLDTLSHFADQPGFAAKMAKLLRPGGLLVVATQNKPVLERWSEIPGPAPGQIRRWVDGKKLRQLLKPNFKDIRITSICPIGDQGMLRIVNSVKLNYIANRILGGARVERLKERNLLGHSLIAYAIRS